MLRRTAAALLILGACARTPGGQSGDGGAAPTDAGGGRDSGGRDLADASTGQDGSLADAAGDATAPDGSVSVPDAAVVVTPGVLDVLIYVANDCQVITTPAAIAVPAGTEFTVNWVHAADSWAPADVDKIDQYNQVPILIGLDPGESYHDDIRKWCGTLYTGTFSFRITGCYDPYYLDVDCGA